MLIYKQADPDWSKDILGFSALRPATPERKAKPAQTIGTSGCLMTAVANVASLTGAKITPRELNVLAKQGGGFVAGSAMAVLPRMALAAGLSAEEKYRVRDADPDQKEDFDRLVDAIEKSLKHNQDGGLFPEGGFCILNVDHSDDDKPDHFVTVVGRDDRGGYIAIDPANGGEIWIEPTLRGVSVWSSKNVKNYVVLGAAPIGR